jgi:hypothetical protein
MLAQKGMFDGGRGPGRGRGGPMPGQQQTPSATPAPGA